MLAGNAGLAYAEVANTGMGMLLHGRFHRCGGDIGGIEAMAGPGEIALRQGEGFLTGGAAQHQDLNGLMAMEGLPPRRPHRHRGLGSDLRP